MLVRYQLLSSGQVPPDVMATWLQDPLFARYVLKRR